MSILKLKIMIRKSNLDYRINVLFAKFSELTLHYNRQAESLRIQGREISKLKFQLNNKPKYNIGDKISENIIVINVNLVKHDVNIFNISTNMYESNYKYEYEILDGTQKSIIYE
jgi:hypothetical protein